MANVLDVAKFFINTDNQRQTKKMSNLRLLKILYIAQGLSLAERSEPLFDADFEAWKLGPVIPAVYHEFKRFERSPIVEQELDLSSFSGEEIRLMFDVDMLTKDQTTTELVNFAHMKDGPWHEVFATGKNNQIISKQDIYDYFSNEIFKGFNNRWSDCLIERIPLADSWRNERGKLIFREEADE